MSRRDVAAVHVWWQDDSDDGPEWVVSTVDETDDEVSCIGGYGSDLAAAWERACSEADDRGVPAVQLDRYTGEPSDRYEPSDSDSESEDDSAERLARPSPNRLVCVQVDEEYSAERWWDALDAARPELGQRLRAEGNAPRVTEVEWAFLKTLPGWDDGPIHAPHPLKVLGPPPKPRPEDMDEDLLRAD